MTGRENIYLNGSILGMSQKEIDAKFESIVAFSEIDEFLDAPVSTYSSGMRVRLGFSVAVHCEPDILLVDEVLSVGDLSFRNKSLRRMHEYREKANAVIFVSHGMEQIRALCNRVIIVNKGKIMYDGPTHEGVVMYEEAVRELRLQEIAQGASYLAEVIKARQSSTEDFELLDLGILDANRQKTSTIGMHDVLTIFWDFKAKRTLYDVYFNAGVTNDRNAECIWVTSKDTHTVQFPSVDEGIYRILIEIPQHHLMPDIYTPNIFIRSDKTGETYERIWSNYAFRVVTDGNALERGIVSVEANWAVEKLE
jgi:ABC-type proline/glycine betaine transport system ATPase subunit